MRAAGTQRPAIVVNPAKVDDDVRERIAQACRGLGAAEPQWYPTTQDDPGVGQARRALADGATVVCALGGDGTVRAVASVLAGTSVPLGLLPGGTGNLLARNLGLPVDDVEDAVAAALTGVARRIDVGQVVFDSGEPQVFVVMCGVGVDAVTMATTDERLKKVAGWLAYLVAGAKALVAPGFRASVVADGARASSQHCRAVVVGNCGELTAGAALLPDARLDDGQLDVALVAPRGVVGWAAVIASVVTANRRGHAALRRDCGARVEVTLRRPVLGELDGDPVGEVRSMVCEVKPGALLVRGPISGE